MNCTENLHFNRVKNQCLKPEEALCLVPVGQTSYGAKGNQLGKVFVSQLPKGIITQVKLVHVSGFVKCSESSTPSKWGCNNQGGTYNSSVSYIIRPIACLLYTSPSPRDS